MRDRPFEKGYGIDFYVDAARFLPDNVTVCKVVVEIQNQNMEKLYSNQSAVANIRTSAFSPVFDYRQELRAPHFDPTMNAVIIIQTIDNTNKEVRIVG